MNSNTAAMRWLVGWLVGLVPAHDNVLLFLPKRQHVVARTHWGSYQLSKLSSRLGHSATRKSWTVSRRRIAMLSRNGQYWRMYFGTTRLLSESYNLLGRKRERAGSQAEGDTDAAVCLEPVGIGAVLICQRGV